MRLNSDQWTAEEADQTEKLVKGNALLIYILNTIGHNISVSTILKKDWGIDHNAYATAMQKDWNDEVKELDYESIQRIQNRCRKILDIHELGLSGFEDPGVLRRIKVSEDYRGRDLFFMARLPSTGWMMRWQKWRSW